MRKILLSLIFLLSILSACNTQPSETDDYLLLMGQSDTWELNNYEIILTTEERVVGNGTLRMKEENEYFTDSFSFNTYAVINDFDDIIHAGSISGRTDISEQKTGTIEGESGNSLTLDDVSSIYMIVEWWDPVRNKHIQERIDLYEKTKSDEASLN